MESRTIRNPRSLSVSTTLSLLDPSHRPPPCLRPQYPLPTRDPSPGILYVYQEIRVRSASASTIRPFAVSPGPRRSPPSLPPSLNRSLSVWTAVDEGLVAYLDSIFGQMRVWLDEGKLQRLVVVVASVATQEVVERWTFEIKQERDQNNNVVTESTKPEKEIQSEIAAIIRQYVEHEEDGSTSLSTPMCRFRYH